MPVAETALTPTLFQRERVKSDPFSPKGERGQANSLRWISTRGAGVRGRRHKWVMRERKDGAGEVGIGHVG
jgi:hypothetical protein